MPLLTVTNLTTSAMAFQDAQGVTPLTFTVQGSATMADRVVTLMDLAALESELVAAAGSGYITWTVTDDPASSVDTVPDHITTVLVSPYNAVAGDQDILTLLTAPGAVSVVLAAGAPIGQRVTVADATGDAGANNVTVTAGGGGSIVGTAVISVNYGAATFLKTGATLWQRVA